MREKTVIAGIGHTAFGKLAGRSTLSLNVEASARLWPMPGWTKARWTVCS